MCGILEAKSKKKVYQGEMSDHLSQMLFIGQTQ